MFNKLTKGVSPERIKLNKIERKIRAGVHKGIYDEYKEIMLMPNIISRRNAVQSVCRTIENDDLAKSDFQEKNIHNNRNTIKVSEFVEKLKSVTKDFTSKRDVRKPMKDILDQMK